MLGFWHQILAGVATGGIYASLALALVMIHQATHHINFAQGEMATFSAYLAYALMVSGVPYWGAFGITVVLSFALGALIERVLLRPLAHAPDLTLIGVFIGLLLILNALCGWIWDFTIKPFPSPFGSRPLLGGLVSSAELGTIAVTFVMLLLIWAFFRFTKLGLAMRAVAHNPESSRLVGIRVGAMLALGWGLAAAVGAVAGMMIAPVVFLDPNMMSGILLYAFAGALLGGLDNPFGAVLGGFLVGVIENVGGAYLVGTELKLSLALAVIAFVLMLKPSGLLGRAVASRV
ncbi:MAG: branched-chain amino acid ABC transporter permease [Acetobacteraceae bacterium]|nr:branched-chain amino acid ABC transporter permease [Acetobacteraceae bacterium]